MGDGVFPEGADVGLPTGVGRTADRQTETEQGEGTSIWSSLIDEIEVSRETQGDYFFEIGKKTPEEDKRAIILREPFSKKTPVPMGSVSEQVFVVFTADGAKGIRGSAFGGIDGLLKTQSIKDIPIDPSQGGFVKAGSHGNVHIDELVIFNQATGSSVDSKEFTLIDLTDADMPMIDKAIVDSIAKAKVESPRKTQVVESPERIKMAKALSARISQLPPKL